MENQANTKENQLDENLTYPQQEKTEKEIRLEEKKQKKLLKKTPEFQRGKIDRLIAKQNIKYRGPFSYRTVRIFGFLAMLFAQLYIAYSFASNIAETPEWTTTLVEVLEILSIFALPLFLMANFCVIMSSKNNVKNFLIFYTSIALLIYFAIVFVYYRYVGGFSSAITGGDPAATAEMSELITKNVFGKIINYNVFVDLALFALFFFFFFYTPKNIKSKKGMLIFRLCSLIPVLITIASTILYGFYYMGTINLPALVLAIMPCRSLTIYAIFFILSALLKLRKQKFIKMGGTEEEYENYSQSNRSSLEVSTLAAIVIFGVCLIDFVLPFISIYSIFFGVGLNFYFVLIIPFIFLLSYTRKPKLKIIDTLLPLIFILLTIILYLEAGLFVIKFIFM